ncbi:methyltransferase [Undibacterium fentianense]|uniref:Class I SAM-dependent methyltransferase n=1 Tax=Undibacterium fentianense TaxID=2828728 RepID=A0A941E0K0_9BURK|nr:class I SAM-dependent methyltransferase [Undibacterium fentianense]MBR7799131.1 class I SAM-dependent methyltransferase [Undibacterium fentianense]
MTTLNSTLNWVENDAQQSLLWRSENLQRAPKQVQVADDTMKAENAYRLACEGTALLWRGDFQNAKNLLQAIARRIDRRPSKTKVKPEHETLHPSQIFHLHRQAQAHRARVLSMLIIPIQADFFIPLRRAPNVVEACIEAYGSSAEDFAISLRELLGVIGAHEWRKNGVHIPALNAKIHPHYAVFSPVRGEYLDLISKAPLPSLELAFDIGTGSGVIAALLAHRGVKKILATDQDQRALACAEENLSKLGLLAQVELLQQDMFPEGLAPLIVCNPPWIPARPNAPIEYAIYDPESRMLKRFLLEVGKHLERNGEAWLVMSDLAEHLGLRTTSDLWTWIDAGELEVIGKLDIRPSHHKSQQSQDPLQKARQAEITSLWRLRRKQNR